MAGPAQANRSGFDQVCALRTVTSTDGMVADSCPSLHEFPSRGATRIINEVKAISRVVYDVYLETGHQWGEA
jgi:GMP synthase PP-ATPase subunit